MFFTVKMEERGKSSSFLSKEQPHWRRAGREEPPLPHSSSQTLITECRAVSCWSPVSAVLAVL